MANAGQARRAASPVAGVGAVNPFYGFLPRQLWRKQKDFFVYSTSFLPIALSATVSQLIAIEADSDFLITSMTYTAQDNALLTTFIRPWAGLITLRDTGSGRNFFNEAQHIENIVGDAELPSFVFPKLIRASSTLEVTLTNQDAILGIQVRVAFLGFKIFSYAEGEA